ncbi:MAG: hypothetical protein A2270_11515 [Elusimicrobia bacterium RIFOXYA12_FULL_51_18]|nr:MAG: hypothetical protein A2270_11515 [Elusimicrobia bacterium RIFOXYA12_FULL_51_18]OGS28794.1 MAG: hypothetical protein A2218_08975 [Elusimicrobia bacterium RIFOXYA2_FULL_53_38]
MKKLLTFALLTALAAAKGYAANSGTEALPQLPTLEDMKTQITAGALAPINISAAAKTSNPFTSMVEVTMQIDGDANSFTAMDLFENMALAGTKKNATDYNYNVTIESDNSYLRSRMYIKNGKRGYMINGDDLDLSIRSFGPDFTVMGKVEQPEGTIMGSGNINFIIKNEKNVLSINESGMFIKVDGQEIRAEFDTNVYSKRMVGVLAVLMTAIQRDITVTAQSSKVGELITLKNIRMPIKALKPLHNELARVEARDPFEGVEVTVVKETDDSFSGALWIRGANGASLSARVDKKRKAITMDGYDVQLTMRDFGNEYRIYGRADGEDVDLRVQLKNGKMTIQGHIFITIEVDKNSISGDFDTQLLSLKGFSAVSAMAMVYQLQ